MATVNGTGCPPDTAAVSVSADYRGFGHLENGAYGVERANYYFQGNSPTAYETHRLDGFYDNDWQFSDSTDGSVQTVYHFAWKSCPAVR